MNKGATSKDIEKMMSQLVKESKEMLLTHKSFLVELAFKLAQAGSLKTEEVKVIATSYDLLTSIKEEGHLISPPYNQILKLVSHSTDSNL